MRERGDNGIVAENGHDERLRQNKNKQQGLCLAAFIVSSIFLAHKLAQPLYLFIIYYWPAFIFIFIVFVVVKEHGEHIFYRFSFCVAHYVDGCIYHLCQELMFQCVAATITANDAPYVPELQVIQKSIMSYTYLTND